MEFFALSQEEYKTFFLILTRISTILFLFPFFGSPSFPAFVKAGLSLALSIFLFPIIKIDASVWPDSTLGLLMMGTSEFVVGLVLSFSVRVFVAAAQMTGQVAGFQLGFSMINVMDPQSGSQVSVLDQMFYWVVLIMFIGMGGHHIILSAVVDSFTILKPGYMQYGPDLAKKLIAMPGDMFILGIKMSAPIMATLLIVDAAFGIMTKFAPQMNVLSVAFPVKITAGLFMCGLALTTFLIACRSFISGLSQLLRGFLILMGGA